MRRLWSILTLAAITLFHTAWAETVSHEQLANGLQIFVKVDKRAPIAVVQLWYKVGSSYEPNGITGISHVLEHMMFEGSKNYPDADFTNTITANGGELNAQTDYDDTFYYETLAADKLPIALKLEADRMQNLTLADTAFNKEIKVVKEERLMRTENNPQGLTYERFMAAAFLASPYHHPVIGWMDDLNHMTNLDVQHWYQQWYAPNNAILVVAGDVDPKNVYQLAQKYFAAIPAHQLPTIRTFAEVPQIGERTVNVNAPAELPWLIMGYSVPSIKTAKVSWEPYALELASDILDSGNSSRFPAQLIRGSEVASSADASYDPFSRLNTLFILDGSPAQNHTIPELQKALLAQITQLQTTPVSAAELERVKTQLLAQKTYAEDSISYQAQLIGSLEAVGLNWQIGENYVSEVDKITPAQIQAVAKKYFNANRLTIAYLKPQKINTSTVINTMPSGPGASNVH